MVNPLEAKEDTYLLGIAAPFFAGAFGLYVIWASWSFGASHWLFKFNSETTTARIVSVQISNYDDYIDRRLLILKNTRALGGLELVEAEYTDRDGQPFTRQFYATAEDSLGEPGDVFVVRYFVPNPSIAVPAAFAQALVFHGKALIFGVATLLVAAIGIAVILMRYRKFRRMKAYY